ncbi:MAG: hypothetical protein AB7I59_15310 [Geminicoccaceae bacterium]
MFVTYLDAGMTAPAAFGFFFRRLPSRRNLLLAAAADRLIRNGRRRSAPHGYG